MNYTPICSKFLIAYLRGVLFIARLIHITYYKKINVAS